MGAYLLRLILAFLVPILPAHAEPEPLWKLVGNWQIRVDTTLNYGCFMATAYEGGTILRLGFDQQSKNGYLIVGNDMWRSLETGKEYELVVQFDNAPPWRGNATAIEIGSGAYLYTPFDDASFIYEFMKKQAVTIQYRGRQVSKLSLRGSYGAGQELITCQKTIEEARNAVGGGSSDPFRPSGRKTDRDPFRY